MAKKTLANTETDRDVDEYISQVKNKTRRSDAKTLLNVLKSIRREEPKIWGVSIIAFGKYSYKRKNGEEYEWFNVGFSPASKHMSIYLMYDINEEVDLLEKLGPHNTGKGCLYIKKLEDIDMSILKKLLQKSDKWKKE